MKKEKKDTQPIRIESRWPVILAVIAVLILVTSMSSRVQPMPAWFPYVMAAGLIIPMAGVTMSRGHRAWRRAEQFAIIAFFLVVESLTLITLTFLIVEMLNQPTEFSGRQLFTTSISSWIINVLACSLMYWLIDLGGPEARANGEVRMPDLHFPPYEFPDEAPEAWKPVYIDYLFHSYSTATAFSAADSLPMTTRAKIFMMLESMLSLMILAVVASRAISLLG